MPDTPLEAAWKRVLTATGAVGRRIITPYDLGRLMDHMPRPAASEEDYQRWVALYRAIEEYEAIHRETEIAYLRGFLPLIESTDAFRHSEPPAIQLHSAITKKLHILESLSKP